jgi:hypothetical protein
MPSPTEEDHLGDKSYSTRAEANGDAHPVDPIEDEEDVVVVVVVVACDHRHSRHCLQRLSPRQELILQHDRVLGV